MTNANGPILRRPKRIDQLIPSIVEHDAVSNHTFEAQRLFIEMGFASEIFAGNIGPGCAGRVRPIAELPNGRSADGWLLYQCSIGSPVAEIFASYAGHKLLDYHNITPAHLVERWLPTLGDEARLGREQLVKLAPKVSYAVADSAFNAAELDEVGFATTRVVPVLIDERNLESAPDEGELDRLRAAKALGGSDWLFVGQVAPHKAQHDLIKAFACYRSLYDPAARLHIVGREMGSAYIDALRRFIRALDLEKAVELPGSVTTEVLAAQYAAADAFVCCSDHEGFCAPVIESMARSLPVVAFAAGALAETIGEAGVLLDSKAPEVVAAAVHLLLADEPTRSGLIVAGRERAAHHTLAEGRRRFVHAIEEAIELACGVEAPETSA